MPHIFEAPLLPIFNSRLFRRVYLTAAIQGILGFMILGIPALVYGLMLDSFFLIIIATVSFSYIFWYIYWLVKVKRQLLASKETFIRLHAVDDRLHYESDSVTASVKWEIIKCCVEYNNILVLAVDKRGNQPLVTVPSKEMPLEMKDYIEDKVLASGGKLIERRTNLLFTSKD